MNTKFEEEIIGYSGFILFEECYEYNENACYIADSKDSGLQFMINCGYKKSEFRIDEISVNDLMNDYGCSCGEYAMEELIFENFKLIADKNGIKYTAEGFDLDPSLMVVQIQGTKSRS